jgi:hypothetical protein
MFNNLISKFCFPSGIQLHYEHQIPQSFSFILTQVDGTSIYGTCLFFDELVADSIKNRISPDKSVWTQKAICIISHHSFLDSFKTILAQIYRIHLSSHMQIPLERFIVNFMDEIPLPDKGSMLV